MAIFRFIIICHFSITFLIMKAECDEDRKIFFVDLSHSLNPNIPFHPMGLRFQMKTLATVGNNSLYKVEEIKTLTHIGTHVDAPSHAIASGWNITDIPLERFIVPAVVVDIRYKAYENPNAMLTVADLMFWEEEYGKIPPGSVLLVLTGWSRFWNNTKIYLNTGDNGYFQVPHISRDAAEWLVQNRYLYGVGIDTLGFETKPGFTIHRIFLGHNLYLIENLTNLDRLPKTGATLYIMPIKIDTASGAPARILAVFFK